MADWESLRDMHGVRLAAAETDVAEWRWSTETVSLARRLVPVSEERNGERPWPVRFLRRAPNRLWGQSLFGFTGDGRVVVERFHAYGRLSAEEFVRYSDDEVEAVRYGHWVVGDPTAGNVAVVAEWTWRLVYEAARPSRYEFNSRDGARSAEEYGYGPEGTLATVVGSHRSRFGDEAWSYRVREAADGGVVVVTDESGNRVYPT